MRPVVSLFDRTILNPVQARGAVEAAQFEALLAGFIGRNVGNRFGRPSIWGIPKRYRLERLARRYLIAPDKAFEMIGGKRDIILYEIHGISWHHEIHLYTDNRGDLYVRYAEPRPLPFRFDYRRDTLMRTMTAFGSRPFPVTREQLRRSGLRARAIEAMADGTSSVTSILS